MLYDVMKYRKTITYLFFIFVKTGFTIDSKAVTATSAVKLRTTVLPRSRNERRSSPRFMKFPNTTWKKANNVCFNYSAQLLLAYDADIIEREILPLMDSKDFIWISVKDYGLNCKDVTGKDPERTEIKCESYIRVKMKPTSEKLYYGLCEKGGGIERKHSTNPLTWNEMNSKCTDEGQLYKFSTLEEGKTLLSIIRPDQLYWTRRSGNDSFPEFSDVAQVVPVCIGLVKLKDSFIFMTDDCESKHSFICDNTSAEYSPAVEALDKKTALYIEEEVERAMTKAVSKPTPDSFQDDSGSIEGTGLGSESAEPEESVNIGAIVGPVVALVIIVVAGTGVYCCVRARKAIAYRKSLFRYESKKSSLNTPKLPCKEITHLPVMERETASAISESQERQEVAEYYDRRYEPLQREVIDACTKRIKLKKGIVNEEQLNQLMNYDPLRKDSFLTSGHGSSYSDGQVLSYEKYDPESAALTTVQQQQALQALLPDKCHGIGSVSYLKQIKTLDDLDQYENSNTLDEENAQLCQKDPKNKVKKLEDLDQYENYNLPPPLSALPTKTRPKKAGKSGSRLSYQPKPRPDCYENHDI